MKPASTIQFSPLPRAVGDPFLVRRHFLFRRGEPRVGLEDHEQENGFRREVEGAAGRAADLELSPARENQGTPEGAERRDRGLPDRRVRDGGLFRGGRVGGGHGRRRILRPQRQRRQPAATQQRAHERESGGNVWESNPPGTRERPVTVLKTAGDTSHHPLPVIRISRQFDAIDSQAPGRARAITSISTRAPRGSAPTATVERAG